MIRRGLKIHAPVMAMAVAMLAAMAVPPAGADMNGARAKAAAALAGARTWAYQLQKVDVDKVAASGFEVFVTDYSRDGGGAGAFTAAEVEKMKTRPDGGRRIVLAYFSIGEAESYRYYWNPAWAATPPGWLKRENPHWKGNFLVDYADPRWKRIVFDYLDRISEAGFDGVYLDKIDSYLDLEVRGPAPMQRFVTEIAERGRQARPGFLVIAQNAEGLLAHAAYRAVIDGLGREDLFWNQEGRGKPTPAESKAWAMRLLDKLVADGKPVFTVDYVRGATVRRVYEDARAKGYVPYATRVELDRLTVNRGLDPKPAE